MSGVYDFRIDRGASRNLRITLTDEEDDPVDLTNYTARMEIAGGTTLTVGDGLTLGDEDGTIDVALTALQTRRIRGISRYTLDLLSGPVITRILRGRIIASRGVTE